MITSSPAPEATQTPRRLLVVDADDHIDPLSRAWVTVDDDGRLVFPDVAEARVAELGARFEAWLLTQTDSRRSREAGWRCSVTRSAPMPTAWGEVSAGHFRISAVLIDGLAWRRRPCVRGNDPLTSRLDSLNAAVYGEARPASVRSNTIQTTRDLTTPTRRPTDHRREPTCH